MKKKKSNFSAVFAVIISVCILGFAFFLINTLNSSPNKKQQGTGFDNSVISDNSSQAVSEEKKVSHMIAGVENIYQKVKWPNGCESVSTVMALKFTGIDITVDEFIDNCLTMTELPFNPNLSYGGNPRDGSGFGCYAPVIKNALDKALKGTEYTSYVAENATVTSLCEDYISKDIPVIFWATQDMAAPFEGKSWEFEGEKIIWIRPEHCLLLVGFDEEKYYFCDPLKTENTVGYNKSDVETAFTGLNSQAVVIVRRESN